MKSLSTILLVLALVFVAAQGKDLVGEATSYALDFSSANQQFVDLKSVNFGAPFTLEFWIKWTGTGTQPIMSFGSSDSSNVRVFIQSSGAGAQVGVKICSDATHCSTVSQASVLDYSGRWIYVAIRATVDGKVNPTSTVSFSYNYGDSLEADGDFSGLVVLPTSVKNNNKIGSDGTSYFDGSLTEIRLWSASLEDGECGKRIEDNDVKRLYAYWPCTDGTGYTLTDFSKSQCHGSLGGGKREKACSYKLASPHKRRSCTAFGSKISLKNFNKIATTLPAGDYWYSTSANYQAQIRVNNRPDRQGNAVTGFAVKYKTDVVALDLDFYGKADSTFYVNGREELQDVITLASGLSIEKAYSKKKHSYVIETKSSDFRVVVKSSPKEKSSKITLLLADGTYANSALQGVCGNYSGNIGITAVGTGESLFPVDVRPVTGTTTTFTCDIFTLFAGTQLLTQAQAVCGNTAIVDASFASDCYEEVCASQDISSAVETAQETYNDCVLSVQNGDSAGPCTEVCPNFCSFQGTCVNGACVCNSGFVGVDCGSKSPYQCFSASWANGQQTVQLDPLVGSVDVVKHYSYGSPALVSSNTGNEVSDSAVIYFYMNNQNGNSANFVFLNDLPRDGSGGKVSASFRVYNPTTNTPITNFNVAVKDDPEDSYSVQGGVVSAQWEWDACCTDGLALSNLPVSSPFCIDVSLNIASGIKRVYVSQLNSYGEQDLQLVSNLAGLKFCGGVCTDPCAAHTDCGSCSADSQCGWCAEEGVCSLGTAAGPTNGVCQNWRFSSDPAVSRVVSSNIDYPILPTQITSYVANGQDLTASFAVNFPPYASIPQEVVVLQELTKTWTNTEISSLSYSSLFSSITQTFPSTSLGFGSYSDKPLAPYGSSSTPDYPYKTDLPLSKSSTDIKDRTAAWRVMDGKDTKNSQLEALFHAVSRDELGWTVGARHVVAVVTKTSFHDVEVNSNLTPFNGDVVVDTRENYPTRLQLKTALLNRNVFPIFVVPSDVAADYNALVSDLGFGLVVTWTKTKISTIRDAIVSALVQVAGTATAVIKDQGRISSVTGTYYGISPLTRVVFQVTLSSSSTATQAGVIVVPGFGQVSLSSVPTDLPVASPCETVSVTSTGEIVIRLDGTNPVYGDVLTTIVTALPSSGSFYQYVDNARGSLVNAGDSLTDSGNRVIYAPAASGTFSYSYKLVDDCSASSPVQTCSISVSIGAINTPPTATGGNVNTQKNTPSAPVTLASSNVIGSPVAIITMLPSSGGILKKTDGTVLSVNSQVPSPCEVIYVPPTGAIGPKAQSNLLEHFSFAILDTATQLTSVPAVFNAFVLPTTADLTPTATSSSASTDDKTNIQITLTAADDTYDPAPLTYYITTLPSQGTLSTTNGGASVSTNQNLGTTNSIWFAPAVNPTSYTTSFTFTVVNKYGNSAVATVTISVSHVNVPPTGTDLTFTVDMNTVTNSLALSGASDYETGTLSYYLCTYGGSGTLKNSDNSALVDGAVIKTGSVSYTPNTNFFGTDGFKFKVKDAAGAYSGCYTATITVNRVNYVPTTSPVSPQSAVEDTTVVVSLAAGDQNPDDTPLTITVCAITGTGSWYQSDNTPVPSTPFDVTNVVGTSATTTVGYLKYYAAIGYTGSVATITYKASDSHSGVSNCSSAITITADNLYAPVVTGPTSVSLNQYQNVIFELTATDADSATLTYTVTSVPSEGLYQCASSSACDYSGSTITVGAALSAPVYLGYKPASSFYGTTGFAFTVSDGQLSTSASVPITVTHVNTAPVATPSTVTVNDNTAVVISLAATDVDNDALTYKVASLPAHGTLLVCSSVDCSQTTTASVNSVAGFASVKYTSTALYQGADSFTFVANDGHVDSPAATVSITVNHINIAPTTSDVSVSTVYPQSSPVTITLVANDADNSVAQLNLYISSTSGLAGSLTQFDGTPISGSNVLVTDTSFRVKYSSVSNQLAVTPFTSFTYYAVDPSSANSNTATVSIAVVNSFNPPVATTTAAFGTEGTPLSITLTATDSSPSVSFRAVITQLPSQGSLLQSDGVTAIAAGDSVTSSSMELIYVPPTYGYGSPYTSFTYVVYNDATGGVSTATQVAVSLTHVNHAPNPSVAVPPVTPENANVSIVLLANDPDGDACTFRFPIIPTMGTLYVVDSQGNVGTTPVSTSTVVSAPTGSATLLYVPPPFTAGSTLFAFYAIDAFGLDSAANAVRVTITVTPVNYPPTAPSITETVSTTLLPLQIFLGASDPNGDALTVTIQSFPTSGTLCTTNPCTAASTLSVANPSFALTAVTPSIFLFSTVQNGGGFDSVFTHTVSDGALSSELATVTIHVIVTNQPPTLNCPTVMTIAKGDLSAQTFTLALKDVDTDYVNDGGANFIIQSLPASPLVLQENGGSPVSLDFPTYDYTVANFQIVNTDPAFHTTTGPVTFLFTICDYPGGVEDCNPTTFTFSIYVLDTNDAPVVSSSGSYNFYVQTGTNYFNVINDLGVADAATYALSVSLTADTTVSSGIALVNSAGLSGIVTSPNQIQFSGTVANINAALAYGLTYYTKPISSVTSGHLTVVVTDGGNGVYQSKTTTTTIPITVTPLDATSLSALRTGVTGGSVAAGAAVLSAGVYGVYRLMKKRKLLPEDADPWETDDAFDQTLDNPLYSGTPTTTAATSVTLVTSE